MDDPERFRKAQERVDALLGFYIHAVVFGLVMALLLAINVATADGWWVQWPFIGWGIGLAGHALAVYGRAPHSIAQWRQRKIREVAQRDSAN